MELIVVLAIIAVLAAITLPMYSRSQGKAREAVCIGNLKQLVAAIQMYAADYGGGLLPSPYGRVPGCTPGKDHDGHSLILDAVDLYLLAGYAPYGANMETWHCPDQPWPRTPE
ncbi:MAG: DUF1559 domain-containing protein, partial [Xanthomonadales bacterium]|nr:DUF1559 domain-containing protein [Xanthomonadales bacterium]